MNQLLLVRHGQAVGGTSGMDRDFFLTELGRRQAHALGARLKAEKVRPRCIYSSVLTRARQTAGILTEHLDAPIFERLDLIEHGSHAYADDCTLREAILRHPERLDADGKVRTHQGERMGLNWSFSIGGEDMRALHARARGAYQSLLDDHRKDDGTFVLVAHGSFLSALLTEVLGLPLRPVWNFSFANCGCMELNLVSTDDGMLPVFSASGPGEQ